MSKTWVQFNAQKRTNNGKEAWLDHDTNKEVAPKLTQGISNSTSLQRILWSTFYKTYSFHHFICAWSWDQHTSFLSYGKPWFLQFVQVPFERVLSLRSWNRRVRQRAAQLRRRRPQSQRPRRGERAPRGGGEAWGTVTRPERNNGVHRT